MGEVDAESDDHGLPFALQENARDLRGAGEKVVRPFEAQLDGGGKAARRLVQRDRRDQRERRRGRVRESEPDQGARVEIAFGRLPRPALAPPAPRLARGAKPAAFRRAGAGERGEVVVGGGGGGDGADQNRALAAFSDTRASGPTRI
jgi:hypothetical protein